MLKEGCRIVLRCNMNISEGWANGTLCEIFYVTVNCILVCKLGCPNDRYPIPKTKQTYILKVHLIQFSDCSFQYNCFML